MNVPYQILRHSRLKMHWVNSRNYCVMVISHYRKYVAVFNEIFSVHQAQPIISPKIVILKKINCEQSEKIIIMRLQYKDVLITTKSPNNSLTLEW